MYKNKRRVIVLLLCICMVIELLQFTQFSSNAAGNGNPVTKTTNMECSIWSAPQTIDANFVKKVPVGYSITVYPNKVTGADGKYYYQTIKGKYILCKCLDNSAGSNANTKVVAGRTMVRCGTTPVNGIALYRDIREVLTSGGNYDWEPLFLEALDASGITADMSDYDKCATLARYLSKRIIYDRAGQAQFYANGTVPRDSATPEGTLRTNVAVCQGYTNAYNQLLMMMGIECYYMHSSTHAWTKIVLDGVDYYTDVTLNSLNKRDSYLMMDYETFVQKHSYAKSMMKCRCMGENITFQVHDRGEITIPITHASGYQSSLSFQDSNLNSFLERANSYGSVTYSYSESYYNWKDYNPDLHHHLPDIGYTKGFETAYSSAREAFDDFVGIENLYDLLKTARFVGESYWFGGDRWIIDYRYLVADSKHIYWIKLCENSNQMWIDVEVYDSFGLYAGMDLSAYANYSMLNQLLAPIKGKCDLWGSLCLTFQ